MNPKQFHSGFTGLSSAELANFLKRTFTIEEETLAETLIEQVEEEFASTCRRNFLYSLTDEDVEYTERFNSGQSIVYPSAVPVKEVTEIKLNNMALDLTENSDYFIFDSYIEFVPKIYSNTGIEHKALEITYTIEPFWGEDVKLAVLKIAGKIWLDSGDAGVGVSERSFASVRETLDNQSFYKSIERVINRYKLKKL